MKRPCCLSLSIYSDGELSPSFAYPKYCFSFVHSLLTITVPVSTLGALPSPAYLILTYALNITDEETEDQKESDLSKVIQKMCGKAGI